MSKATLVAIIAAACASCTMPPPYELRSGPPPPGCADYGNPMSCFFVTPAERQEAAFEARQEQLKAAQAKADAEAQKRQQEQQAAQAAAVAAKEDRDWANERRLGAIAYGMAKAACGAVTETEIVSAYNAQHFAYLGHPITFKSAGGAVADPRNGWVGNDTGASSPYGATCSAFGQAETTDGTGLSIVAPLSFILSASGNSIAAVSIQP